MKEPNRMTGKPELKPCPFCGGEADYEEADLAGDSRKSVGCHNEDCYGYQSVATHATYGEAAKAWNKRTK